MTSSVKDAHGAVGVYFNSVVGSGTFGKICRAKCGLLPCVAKVFDKSVILSKGNRKGKIAEFEKDCKRFLSLRHPSLIQYLGTANAPNAELPLFFMEVFNKNLTQFLQGGAEPLPFHMQVNVSYDVALGIDFLHFNSLIHGFLSSNNILIIGEGSRAKLTDYSFYKYVSAEHLTSERNTALLYFAPEVVKSQSFSTHADCFAFGVLLIQIITSRSPMPIDTSAENKKISVIESRRKYIELSPSGHQLLPIALDCLKDSPNDRKSSSYLCEQLAEVRKMKEYQNSREQYIASLHEVRQKLQATETRLRESEQEIKRIKEGMTTDSTKELEIKAELNEIEGIQEIQTDYGDMSSANEDEQIQTEEKNIPAEGKEIPAEKKDTPAKDIPDEDKDTPVEDKDIPAEDSVEDKDIPAEDKDTPVEDKDIPAEDKDTPVEDKDIPAEDKHTPVEDKDIPAEDPVEDKDIPAEDKDTPVEVKDIPAEDKHTPVEDKDIPAEDPVEDKDIPAEDKDTPVEVKDIPAEDPVEDKDIPAEDKDTPVEVKDIPAEYPMEDKDIPVEDTLVEDKDIPTEDKDTLMEDKNIPVEDTLVEDKDIPTEDKDTLVEDKDIPTEDKDAPVEDKDIQAEDAPVEDKNIPAEDKDTLVEYKDVPAEDTPTKDKDIPAEDKGIPADHKNIPDENADASAKASNPVAAQVDTTSSIESSNLPSASPAPEIVLVSSASHVNEHDHEVSLHPSLDNPVDAEESKQEREESAETETLENESHEVSDSLVQTEPEDTHSDSVVSQNSNQLDNVTLTEEPSLLETSDSVLDKTDTDNISHESLQDDIDHTPHEDIKWSKKSPAPETMCALHGTVAVHGNIAYLSRYYNIFSYDMPKDKWSQLKPSTYQNFSLAVLNDAIITIGGISREGKRTRNLYGLSKGRWRVQYSPMPEQRVCAASLVTPTHLVIAGGRNRRALDSVDIMEITTSQWHSLSQCLPEQMGQPHMTLCYDTLFLGVDTRVYSSSLTQLIESSVRPKITEFEWKKVKDLPDHLDGAGLVTLRGRVVAIGGHDIDDKLALDICCFDEEADSWPKIDNLPLPYRDMLTAPLGGNMLLIVGGWFETQFYDSTYIERLNVS